MKFKGPTSGICSDLSLIKRRMNLMNRKPPHVLSVPFEPRPKSSFEENRLSFRLALRSALLVCLLLALNPSAARARGYGDDNKNVELRTVHGIVIDKNENGVSSSIVYLENMKTQGVRTYIADDAGNYRFSGLDPNEDYEIHAEKGELTSSTRTISSFDSRRDIEVVLRLIHKKK